jgi:hypothetical protein
MNTTDLLIIATAAGPIVATLIAPGFTSAVVMLAKARPAACSTSRPSALTCITTECRSAADRAGSQR